MKLSDIIIGQMFKTKYYTYLKVHSFEAYDDDGEEISCNCLLISPTGAIPAWINQATEVELITKCANCKHYTKKSKSTSYDYCAILESNISSIQEGDKWGLSQDPRKFSCSRFERK